MLGAVGTSSDWDVFSAFEKICDYKTVWWGFQQKHLHRIMELFECNLSEHVVSKCLLCATYCVTVLPQCPHLLSQSPWKVSTVVPFYNETPTQGLYSMQNETSLPRGTMRMKVKKQIGSSFKDVMCSLGSQPSWHPGGQLTYQNQPFQEDTENIFPGSQKQIMNKPLHGKPCRQSACWLASALPERTLDLPGSTPRRGERFQETGWRCSGLFWLMVLMGSLIFTWIIRNLLHFFTLTMKYQKGKVKKTQKTTTPFEIA